MIYCYKCPNVECGATDERAKPAKDIGLDELCPRCKTPMIRNYAAERPHVQNKDYKRPIISDSLAMNPNQIAEHNKMFPDVRVLDDGRPVFTSFRQHDEYLKKTGFVKNTQKIKKHGKRIA